MLAKQGNAAWTSPVRAFWGNIWANHLASLWLIGEYVRLAPVQPEQRKGPYAINSIWLQWSIMLFWIEFMYVHPHQFPSPDVSGSTSSSKNKRPNPPCGPTARRRINNRDERQLVNHSMHQYNLLAYEPAEIKELQCVCTAFSLLFSPSPCLQR